MDKDKKRFESYLVPQANGCINWSGSKSHNGYGWFHYKGKTVKAHRVAWFLAGNNIPAHLMLRHKCLQNRACCNVDHLQLGTAKENSADMIRDGTHYIPGLKGESIKAAKLLKEEVLEIRAKSQAGETHREIAQAFNITPENVSCIVLRKTWKHI
jgi:hypothetical protein